MIADEVTRLAAMGNALRPDWPVASLRTFLEVNLSNRAYGDTAVALAWVAAKCPETRTPRLLLEPGPWWHSAVTTDPAYRALPPKRSEACHTCGRHLDGCICGERTTRPPRSTPPPPAYTAARAALRRPEGDADGDE